MAKLRRHLHNQLKHLSKADIHIHSDYSDGRPSIEEILDYVQNKTNLDVIAITDHDTIEGAQYAHSLMKKKKYRFELIIGEEVSSNEGHILGLFLKEKIEPDQPAHEVLIQIHAQGGIAIAAHPFYKTRMNNGKVIWAKGVGATTLIQEKNHFQAIETVNATPTFEEENLRAKYINRILLFRAETGSSDAHILQAIGKGYTLFEGKTAKALKEALLGSQTQAMNDNWDILGVARYAYFFLPIGLRTALNTLIHGRRKKVPEIVNFPSHHLLKKEIEGELAE
jgi:predicted metal-dependent phosphoesterase TrpH